ncbi:MAG: hypothetical protein GEU74_10955 [Nitriliruptorales bacterium]|nr:hypothetical protein [Nitriliruptorales bacterium]
MWNTMTDAERRVLALLQQLGSATRSEVVVASGLPPGDAEHSLDSLWCAGFIGCATTYFVASGGTAADDWRYSVYPRGRAAMEAA